MVNAMFLFEMFRYTTPLFYAARADDRRRTCAPFR